MKNGLPGGGGRLGNAGWQGRIRRQGIRAGGALLLVLPLTVLAAWEDASGLERLSPVRLYAVPEPVAPRAMTPEEVGMAGQGGAGALDVYGLTWQPVLRPQGAADARTEPVRDARNAILEGRLGLSTDGMARWVYRGAEGPDLAFGALPGSGLKLSGSAPIAGVRLQSGRMDGVLAPGAVGYSSALGWLDYSAWNAGSGAVQYGVSAGQTAVRYGWQNDLTLEGQVQTAAKMRNVGLGGVYSLGEWGRLRAGAAHSRYERVEGSRYNLGYVVNVYDWLEVGYRAEYAMSGYSDLSRYASGPLAQPRMQGTLETGVPLANWGTISGTYSDVRYGNTTVQRMGIAHSLALRRNVQLKWEADRDIVSGDYGMRLNLSLPVNLLGD